MTGVTIIDVIKIYDIADWQLFLCFIPFIVSAIISFTIMYKSTKDLNPWELLAPFPTKISTIIVVIGAAITIGSMLYADKQCPAELIETQYEVKIDSSADFNEVYDKYKIKSKNTDTDTFIVVEKN